MDNVAEVKSRIGILDVVSPVVALKKAGKTWKGCCPFHTEKTPSFSVSPDQDAFYCFGCGVGGDIFTFIEKFENLDFNETLELLADRANVEIKRDRTKMAKSREEKDRGHEVQAAAQGFFVGSDPEFAKKYVLERGFGESVAKDWGIGFAPDKFDAMLEVLQKKGFAVKEMVDGSLLSEKNGKFFDKFRGRVTIPIKDLQGRVVAFGARAIADGQEPKYLNSAAHELYDKSSILFGMNRAKSSVRERKFALLAEGYFDVIGLHAAGFANAVATCGTSVTTQQLKIIKRYADELVLILDGDKAGLKATARALPLAKGLGFHVTCVEMPDGQDPDDFAREDPAGLKKAIENRTPAFDFLLKRAVEICGIETTQARTKILGATLPLLAGYASAVEKEIEAKKLAGAIGVSVGAILEELKRVRVPENMIAAEKKEARRGVERVVEKPLAYLFGFFRAFESELEDLAPALPEKGDISENEIAAQSVKVAELCETWSAKKIREGGEKLLAEFAENVKKREKITVTDALRAAKLAGDEAEFEKMSKKLVKMMQN